MIFTVGAWAVVSAFQGRGEAATRPGVVAGACVPQKTQRRLSPDVYDEAEILLEGRIGGLQVTEP
jgi:hypothetical protein